MHMKKYQIQKFNHLIFFNRKIFGWSFTKMLEVSQRKINQGKKPAASGSAAPIKKEWPHLKSLKFLDDALMVQKR